MKNIDELRAELAALENEVRELAALEDITEEQDVRFDELTELVPATRALVEKAAARAALREQVGDRPTVPAEGPQLMRRVETENLDVRSLSRGEARDAALKTIEREADRGHITLRTDALDALERKINTRNQNTDGDKIARRLLVTETEAYRSAWTKAMASASPAWTSDEVRAIEEFRAQSIGTDGAGGFGVPVLIDPTIMITSGAADVAILEVSRVETITNDEWKGVNSTGSAWSFDSEGATVSDDSVTLTQPTVTTYKAQNYIPFSIEVGMDYPNFAGEMQTVIAQGYLDLIAAQAMTGANPTGIFTAIDATAASEVAVTTDGSLGPADAKKVWAQLPERFKPRATWVGDVSVFNEIRNSGDDPSLFTVDLAAGMISQLLGKRVIETDYAPSFTGTTGAANLLVVGDFSNYLVAQRAGMNTELHPLVVDVTNNRPTGERGFYSWARVGMDSINDNAFRLLQNQ